MPIQFPQPKQGNPFDEWLWKRGAKPPQQQPAPNLANPGLPFNRDSMNPGIGRPKSRPNLRNPKIAMYQHGDRSGLRPNGAETLRAAPSVNDGAVQRVFVRALGSLNMSLSGISRDASGATLGSCKVMVFRTEDKTLVAETTSDASGNWTIPLLKGGPFFLVEYKAGSPDVAGTSLNTLVPTQV